MLAIIESYFLKFNSTTEGMVQYRIFIGNPGVGKSTLANCMAKKVLFQSGVSVGKGMTYKLDESKHNGITYLDTPGLADIKMRKAAATAITEGLRKNGTYQIFFVVTLEAGRLRPTDLATIKLVLENAKDIISYNLIINKLSKSVYDNLCKDDREELKKLISEVESQVGKDRKPPNVFPLMNDVKLYDAENEFVKNDDIDQLNMAPYVNVYSGNVNDIPGDDESIEEVIESVTKELNELRSNENLLMPQPKEIKRRSKVPFTYFYFTSVISISLF